MTASADTPRWRFTPERLDGVRSGGDLAAMSFENDLETFIREVLQNSLDARLPDPDNDLPVHVELRLVHLAGETKQRFLAAMDYRSLQPHLDGASRSARPLIAGMRRLEDSRQPIALLVVSDSHAVGLSGPEKGEGRYAAFVRNRLISEKSSGSAAGSYGLGKAVLWRNSGIGTVLVHSVPAPIPRQPAGARFIGICQLPFHRVGSKEFDGPGWYGQRGDGTDQWSAAVEPPGGADLAGLQLQRPPATGYGTSLAVVDFLPMHDLSPADVSAEIRRIAAHHFWPALAGPRPRLRVEIVAGGQAQRVDAAAYPEVQPFLQLMRLVPADRDPEELRRGTVPLRLPRMSEEWGERAEVTWHDKLDVPTAFEVSVLAVENAADALAGKLALVRGAGMVVQYLDLRADRPAYALAAGGTAVGEEREHKLVEQMLRTAEPPSHQAWTAKAPRFSERYERGGKTEIEGLPRKLREKALDLLRGQAAEGARPQVPAALRKALSTGTGRTLGPVTRAGRFDAAIERMELADVGGVRAWRFSGWASNTRPGPWILVIECELVGEGGGERLDLTAVRVGGQPGVEEGGRYLVPSEGRFVVEGIARLGAFAALARDASVRVRFASARAAVTRAAESA